MSSKVAAFSALCIAASQLPSMRICRQAVRQGDLVKNSVRCIENDGRFFDTPSVERWDLYLVPLNLGWI